MAVQIALRGHRLRNIARGLKAGFDDLQETDSGWRFVQFNHPAWGRDAGASRAERIPGVLIVSSDEPGPDVDALVVVVGYVDSFTGDVHLGNGMVVPASATADTADDEPDADEYPNRRLAAVALFDDNGPQALIGSVHETRESRFELVSLGHDVDTAIQEWIEDEERKERSHGRR
jgi:hypothetical protein